jgi:subfamily B ATP-binding cassette protein MsbA
VKLQAFRALIREHPWALPAFIGLGLLASIAEALSIGLFVPILQSLIADDALPSDGLIQRFTAGLTSGFDPEDRIYVLGGTVIGLLVLRAMVTFAYTLLSQRTATEVTFGIRSRILRLLLDVDYSYVVHQRDGRFLDVLHAQAWRAGQLFHHLALVIVFACNVLVFIPVLVLVSWQLTLTAIVGMAVVSAVALPLARRAERIGKEAVLRDQDVAAGLMGTLASMRTIRAYGREDVEHAQVMELADRDRDVNFRLGVAEQMATPALEVLYAPLLVAVVGAAYTWDIGAPVVITSLALLYRMYSKFQFLHAENAALMGLRGALEEVEDVSNRENKSFQSSGDEPFERIAEKVCFEKVSFAYRAVRELEFEIEAREMTAIVGRSGAGKSTIVNLLLRLFDPHSGVIRVDGRPLREFDLRSWRGGLAIAGQDTDLIAGTVAENIGFGRAGATPEEIECAARKAEAHEFISELSQGYSTNIGERGQLLSAGQRQRSSLDSITAASIDATIAGLTGESTVLVIAHRLEAVRAAHKVVVMDEGRIVEVGSPETLLAAGGAFKEMWDQDAVSRDQGSA